MHETHRHFSLEGSKHHLHTLTLAYLHMYMCVVMSVGNSRQPQVSFLQGHSPCYINKSMNELVRGHEQKSEHNFWESALPSCCELGLGEGPGSLAMSFRDSSASTSSALRLEEVAITPRFLWGVSTRTWVLTIVCKPLSILSMLSTFTVYRRNRLKGQRFHQDHTTRT